MLVGIFEQNIKEDGILSLPVAFQTELQAGMTVTRGFDRCVVLFPPHAWGDLAQRVNHLSLGDAEARLLRRLIFAEAAALIPDEMGRLSLPRRLLDYAEITERAVLVGLDTHCELWSPERWAQMDDQLRSRAVTLGEQFVAQGL